MSLAVRIEPPRGAPGDVEYQWDADTDILTARLQKRAVGEGASGAVEIQGSDGSWLILDLAAGVIQGVEVAVWPNVRKRSTLEPPSRVEHARVAVPLSGGAVASIELDTALSADADEAERTFHFRVGPARPARSVRIAGDLLLDVDARDEIAGVWLLNVPPFPEGEGEGEGE